jgi:hypothetical protein
MGRVTSGKRIFMLIDKRFFYNGYSAMARGRRVSIKAGTDDGLLSTDLPLAGSI